MDKEILVTIDRKHYRGIVWWGCSWLLAGICARGVAGMWDVDVIDGDALAGSVARDACQRLAASAGSAGVTWPSYGSLSASWPFSSPRLTASHCTQSPVFCDYPTFLFSLPPSLSTSPSPCSLPHRCQHFLPDLFNNQPDEGSCNNAASVFIDNVSQNLLVSLSSTRPTEWHPLFGK